MSDILEGERYWRMIGAGNWRRGNNYGEELPRRKIYLRWKRSWKIYLQGKYLKQVNTTREEKNIDWDIFYENLLEKRIDSE